MPTLFVILAATGLVIVFNARRAVSHPLVLIPSFFASWLVIELAPQMFVVHWVAVAGFVALGALREWIGWLGLAISTVTGGLLWGMVREAFRVRQTFDDVLTPAIGSDAAHAPVVWKEFIFPFKLWSRRIRRERNIPYTEGGRRRHQLDVWHDEQAGPGRPCLLYVPGGAWTIGITNKNHQGKPLLIEMATRGWVCFSMNYPVSPRATFPDHIVAVKKAIAWIREHAREYGGDPGFLMVSGNSAGGHLSSLAALSADDKLLQPGFEDADTSIQAAAPLYGVYDFTGAMLDDLPRRVRRHKEGFLRFIERSIIKRKLASERAFFESVSPWHRIGTHAPPFFVIHGAMDTLAPVEEARAFVDRLREASDAPVIYAELRGTQHAFDQFLSIRSLYAVRAIARFGDWAFKAWKVSGGDPARPSSQERQSPTSPT